MLDIEAPGLLEVESLAPASPPVNMANRSSDALSPAAALMAAAQPAAQALLADRGCRHGSPDRVRARGARRERGLRLVRGPARWFRLALCVRNREHCGTCDTGVPDRRHLSGAGVPRPRKAIFPVDGGLVRRLSHRHRRDFLRQGRRPVFAGVAWQLLRDRVSSCS